MNPQHASLRSRLVNFFSSPAGRALIALLLVLLMGVVFNAHGTFFKIETHRAALREISVCGILACGMTLVIITAGIDLSVGSVLALVAVLFSLMIAPWGWPAWLALLACLAAGAACGAVSGTLAARLQIQPFIATLAMMVFGRGLAKAVSGGDKVPMGKLDAGGRLQDPPVVEIIDSEITWSTPVLVLLIVASLAAVAWVAWSLWRRRDQTDPAEASPESGRLLGVPLPVVKAVCQGAALPLAVAVAAWGNFTIVTVILLACAAITWLLLARHRWGRELYAIGGNEEAARLSGVPVRTAKTLAYAASGALAAVAGICYAAQAKYGDPNAGSAYELTAIAIVVVGGTSLMGGRGGMVLTLLGALTIGYLEKILSINAVGDEGRLMLTGVIVVAAVLMQRRRR